MHTGGRFAHFTLMVGDLVILCTGGRFGHFTLMVGDLVILCTIGRFCRWPIWSPYVLVGDLVILCTGGRFLIGRIGGGRFLIGRFCIGRFIMLPSLCLLLLYFPFHWGCVNQYMIYPKKIWSFRTVKCFEACENQETFFCSVIWTFSVCQMLALGKKFPIF